MDYMSVSVMPNPHRPTRNDTTMSSRRIGRGVNRALIDVYNNIGTFKMPNC